MEEEKILTPIKAIRKKCLDCCCQQIVEVRECPVTSCPLYPYRMGHNPKLKGRRGNADHLRAWRENQTIAQGENDSTYLDDKSIV